MVREVSLLVPVRRTYNNADDDKITTKESYPSKPPSLTDLSHSSSFDTSPESPIALIPSKAGKNVGGALTVPPLDEPSALVEFAASDVFSFAGGCIGCDGVFYESSEVPPSIPQTYATSNCPCCKHDDDNDSVVHNGDSIVHYKRLLDQRAFARHQSLLSLDDEDDALEDQQGRTGVLDAGTQYCVNQILVEGILHKKGTGNDWLRSRNWKARWARLVLARVEGYGNVNVPLLCVSWYQKSSVNSTVVILDGTVVIASDKQDKVAKRWHHSRFEIRHAATRENASLPVTRVFTAPSQKARDAWVYAISQALLSYEKEKAAFGKQQKAISNMYLKPAVQHWALSSNHDECGLKTSSDRNGPLRSPTRPQVPLSPRNFSKAGSPAGRLRASSAKE